MSWRALYLLDDDDKALAARRRRQKDQYIPAMVGTETGHQKEFWTEEWYFHKDQIFSNKQSVLFRKRLEEMYQTSEYSDVTLTAGTSIFKVHKVVLAAGSDYFNAMFSSSWNEISSKCVELKGITPTGLRAIIDYIYTSGFKVTESDVSEILEGARHCLMSDVTNLIETFLLTVIGVNAENYLDMFELAKEYDLNELLCHCSQLFEQVDIGQSNFLSFFEFMKLRPHSVFVLERALLFTAQSVSKLTTDDRQSLFRLLEPSHMETMFNDTNRQGIFTNISLVEFLLDWVKFDNGRVKLLPKLFNKINLVALGAEVLESISMLPLIKDSDTIMSLIYDALEYISKMVAREHDMELDTCLVTFSGQNMEMHSISGHKLFVSECVFPMPVFREKSRTLSEDSFFFVVNNILFLLGLGWLENIEIGDYRGNASCCYSYDPMFNSWKQLANLPVARTGNRLIALDNDIYSIGGKTLTNKTLNLMDIYNVSDDSWNNTTNLPYSFSKPLAAALNGSIYVSFLIADKKGPRVVIKDFFRFDPAGKMWTRRAPIQMGCYQDLVPSGGRLYMIGVKDSIFRDRSNLIASSYNPSTNQWTFLKISHSNIGVYSKVQAILNKGRAYVVADFDDTEREDEKESPSSTRLFVLDPESNELCLKQSYKYFQRDGMSFAVLRVPGRTLKSK